MGGCASPFSGGRRTTPGLYVSLIAIGAVTGQAQAASGCFGHKPTIVGTNGRDNLDGTAGRNVIAGKDGKDAITRLAETILSAEGRRGRTPRAGRRGQAPRRSGRNSILAGVGNDLLYGDGGADLSRGQGGDDVVRGGASRDSLGDEAGQDVIHGGRGRDVIFVATTPAMMSSTEGRAGTNFSSRFLRAGDG